MADSTEDGGTSLIGFFPKQAKANVLYGLTIVAVLSAFAAVFYALK